MRRSALAAIAAAALLTGSALGGCGDSNEPTQPGTGKLTVWMMGSGSPDQTSFLDGVEQDFQRKHPGTDVEVQYVPWGEASKKFQTALAGGGGPDVTEVGNTDTQSWAAQDAFADLTERAKGWPEARDIVPSMLENDKFDGQTVALPWYAGVRAIYYRTDWFAELGIELPATQQELVEAAKKIQAAKPGVSGLAVAGDYNFALFPFIWSHGGEIATKQGDTWKAGVDSPTAKRGIDFYTGLVTRAQVSPPASISWNELEPQKQFALEKAGMIIAGNWAQTEMAKDNPNITKVMGSFPVPGTSPGKIAPAFAGGSDLAIWKDSPNADLAWDYLTVLLSKQNSLEWAKQSKFFPAYSDLLASDDFQSDAVMAGFAKQLTETKMVPLTPAWVEVDKNKAVLQNMVRKIMQGEQSVDEAAAAAAAEMNKILNST